MSPIWEEKLETQGDQGPMDERRTWSVLKVIKMTCKRPKDILFQTD